MHQITSHSQRTSATAARMPTLLLPHLLLFIVATFASSFLTSIWTRTFRNTCKMSSRTSWHMGKEVTKVMLLFTLACSCAVLTAFFSSASQLERKKFSAIFTVSTKAGEGFVNDCRDCEKFLSSINFDGAQSNIKEARQFSQRSVDRSFDAT